MWVLFSLLGGCGLFVLLLLFARLQLINKDDLIRLWFLRLNRIKPEEFACSDNLQFSCVCLLENRSEFQILKKQRLLVLFFEAQVIILDIQEHFAVVARAELSLCLLEFVEGIQVFGHIGCLAFLDVLQEHLPHLLLDHLFVLLLERERLVIVSVALFGGAIIVIVDLSDFHDLVEGGLGLVEVVLVQTVVQLVQMLRAFLHYKFKL